MRPFLESIHIAPTAAAPMIRLSNCVVHPTKGIEGDRYHHNSGTWSTWPKDHELTLIEGETLDTLIQSGFRLHPGDTRRNLTTRAIALNSLVGKEFRIGNLLCRGTRLCDPCAHLERLLNQPGLTAALAGKGGLRAILLESGEFHEGAPMYLTPTLTF